jgi:hypothetical protein
MNLNGNQIMAIIIAILGVLIGSASQLTDLFGPNVAKTAISVASLANSILASVLAVVTSQSATVKAVAAMPGVTSVTVNRQATQALAAVAVSDDASASKVSPIPGDAAKVEQIAKGTTA